jgi:kynurenine formamidase
MCDHRVMYPGQTRRADRHGLEWLAGLGRVPAAGAALIVGASKTRGGTGGPARIFAMV